MRAPAHTVTKHKPRTAAQRLIMELDSTHVRCPVHDITLPTFGGRWFGKGYLQLKANRDTISITNVWIDPRYRRGGHGNRMMRAITRLADKHGVTLELFAEQFDQGGMRTAQLWQWYAKHGFARKLTKLGKPYVNGYATRNPR